MSVANTPHARLNQLKQHTMKNLIFNDVDGNELSAGNLVVALDVDDLENGPKRGELLRVTKCDELESNYILFSDNYGFYGHRVLKISNQ